MCEGQFLELLKSEKENYYSEQDDALNILCTEFGIKSRPNVYQYVKYLQANFDYSIILFSEEYYNILDIEE